MFFLGVAMLTLILLNRYRRYYGKKKGRRAPSKSELQRDGLSKQPLADAPVEVLRWQVEMHESARDLKAEIDSKFVLLQTLTAQATEQSQRLQSLIERAEKLDLLADGRGDDELSQIERIAEGIVEDLRAVESEDDCGRVEARKQAESAVFELADRGLNARSIADRTGRSLGDVELLLAARPQSSRPVESDCVD
jgi:hypothetical protein